MNASAPLPAKYQQLQRSGLILPTSLISQLRVEAAAEFRGAAANRLRSGWNLGRTNTTPATWTLQRLREYSRDLDRNDPVASGVIDTYGVNIVGQGLQPQSRLRSERLGISEDRARELQRRAEDIFTDWKLWADAGNRLNFDEQQFVALAAVVRDGEVLANLPRVDESWRPVQRAVELLEADRLTTVGAATMTGRETGIDVGARGEPLFYNLTKIDPTMGLAQYGGETLQIPARDSRGRPHILHLFRTKRPGQMRGLPLFTPVITLFQDLADYLEAEVVAAKVAACLAIFVTKNENYGGEATVTDREAETSRNIEDLEPGEIRYLLTGESINVVDPKRGGETFNAFVQQVLRILGIPLGLPYELLVKDFSQTNYSSARAALLEGRRLFLHWRNWFAAKFCQPIWELVLEEAWLRDLWPAPDFYQNRTELLRATWIGGGWGWVDPVKEVEASKLAIDYALSTLAEECAGQGRDHEEVLRQRKREQDLVAELGVVIAPAKGQIINIGEQQQEGGNNAQTQ